MSFAVYFIIIKFSQVSRNYFVCINAACVYRLRSLTGFFFFHGVLHLIHKILFFFNVYHYFWGFFPQNHKNNSHCWNYTSTAFLVAIWELHLLHNNPCSYLEPKKCRALNVRHLHKTRPRRQSISSEVHI